MRACTFSIQGTNSVFSRLSLVIVEVSRDGDHGLGDLLAELDLSDLLHLRCVSRSGSGRSNVRTLVRTMEEISSGD